MAYSTGLLKDRIQIARRADEQGNSFGKQGQPRYQLLGSFWANATFSKGVKALHEGALDAYDTVMFRLRYHDTIDRWCIIRYQGKWHQIQSFHADEHDNQIQITAQEMANQSVTLADTAE